MDLTAAQIEKLLTFRGYGNPSDRFWFVGMEEGGTSDVEHLRIRANKFNVVEDLAESHKNFKSHNMSKLISTWRLMSAIVGRISGESKWWDQDFARDYQNNQLGHLGGETYLTEVLPLPKHGLSDWPYGNIFDSPRDYFDKRFPYQLTSIRAEYRSAKPKPQFVICYGKTYWRRHRQVFDFIDFQPAMNDAIQWGRNESTVFLLTNFLDYGWTGFTQNFVDTLCEFALSKSPN
jgi:hypothetical protein